MRVSSSMGQLTQSAPMRAHGAQKQPTVWVRNPILKDSFLHAWWHFICCLCLVPSIAQRCPLLVKAPPNGTLLCSHPHAHSSYGSRCEFECKEGFWLRGVSAIACNSSGIWSHDLPTCQRKCWCIIWNLVVISGLIPLLLCSHTVWGHPHSTFISFHELLPSHAKLQFWLPVFFLL